MTLERGPMSRRGFLQTSIAALAATGIPAWFTKELVADAEQQQTQQLRPFAPSDTILMGHIGCGNPINGRGRVIANQARQLPGVQYVACCDVERAHREDTARLIAPGRQIALFNDFRELLARRDINAVTIATPNHWHTLIAIAAMRAGKDVYCEKPLTLTVDEGKALVRVARETNRRLQTGSQQRSDYNGRFRLACEMVRNGRLGAIQTIECFLPDNVRGGAFATAQPGAGFDWDMWQGPTPRVEYVPQRCHYTFRWWYEYSGGQMANWGAHHLDIAQWALNMDHSGPIEIEGRGDAPDNRPHAYNIHTNINVTYRYANNTTVRVTSRSENGLRITGENGRWIHVTRNNISASDMRLLDPLPGNAVRLPANGNHMQNFFHSVRSRQQPICNAEVGHRSATVCHLGNIAIRTGQRLRWNPETERFVDNDAANLMLGREGRGVWRLEG